MRIPEITSQFDGDAKVEKGHNFLEQPVSVSDLLSEKFQRILPKMPALHQRYLSKMLRSFWLVPQKEIVSESFASLSDKKREDVARKEFSWNPRVKFIGIEEESIQSLGEYTTYDVNLERTSLLLSTSPKPGNERLPELKLRDLEQFGLFQLLECKQVLNMRELSWLDTGRLHSQRVRNFLLPLSEQRWLQEIKKGEATCLDSIVLFLLMHESLREVNTPGSQESIQKDIEVIGWNALGEKKYGHYGIVRYDMQDGNLVGLGLSAGAITMANLERLQTSSLNDLVELGYMFYAARELFSEKYPDIFKKPETQAFFEKNINIIRERKNQLKAQMKESKS